MPKRLRIEPTPLPAALLAAAFLLLTGPAFADASASFRVALRIMASCDVDSKRLAVTRTLPAVQCSGPVAHQVRSAIEPAPATSAAHEEAPHAQSLRVLTLIF